MNAKTVMKIFKEVEERFDKLAEDEMTLLTGFSHINKVVSNYRKQGINAFMHVSYYNGTPIKGICFITDGGLGGILYQSDEDFLPLVKFIAPEEHAEFLEDYGYYINPQYPELPIDEDEE